MVMMMIMSMRMKMMVIMIVMMTMMIMMVMIKTTMMMISICINDHLSPLLSQDVVELHQLSRLTNMEPILFVRVPPPGSRTVDTDPPDGAPRGTHTLAPLAARDGGSSGGGGLHYNNTLLMASSPTPTSHFPEDLARDGGAWPSHHHHHASRGDSRGAGSVRGRGSGGGSPPLLRGCGSSSCPVSLGVGITSSSSSALPPQQQRHQPLSSSKSSPPLSPSHRDNHSLDSNGNSSANYHNNIININNRRRGSKDSNSSPNDENSSTTNKHSYSLQQQQQQQQAYHHPACCVHEQLNRLGYIRAPEPNLPDPACVVTSSSSSSSSSAQWQQAKREHLSTDSHLLERFTDFQPRLARFTRRTLQTYLVNAATVLNNSHTRCLNMFILSAFDMARDMLITPRKLEFAREKEEELYKSLLGISVSKLDEIKELIATTIQVIGNCIVAEAGEFEFIGESCLAFVVIIIVITQR
ncbi:dual serine/threonine and tyrosine protein kinase [Elysia marginata]|uniref:Dual serine/threonine and tyrosine protein kinase n=1 Tax=Elysia marginata TaxID=1093978 RepID=A0AAV4HIY7_9GAST|nr:dual serine/threonine and tyrosine protein kinase [Elysia marginata]